MRKIFTKLICITAAVTMSVGVFAASACGTKNPTLSGDYSGVVDKYDNGGFAVTKGNYTYFINGKQSNTEDNTYGKVVKGAIMRISSSDLAARKYSSAETVVPQMAYSGNSDGGIFIYGDYVYYSTPATEKNSDGQVQNTYLSFRRTKLDGTDVYTGSYLQFPDNTVEYRYVSVNDKVYLLYVAENEDLYGTKYTNIHSVNTETGEDTLLAYNVSSYMFDKSDLTNPRIYYTMKVPNFVAGDKSTFSAYNQVYTVTADVTEKNTYDIASFVEEYDEEEDPIYVNCGTLVLDGIGKVQGMTESITQFNSDELKGDNAVSLDRSAYTYTLSSYEHGTLYYSRKASYDPSSILFRTAESELLAAGHRAAADNPANGDYFVLDASNADSYTYIYNADDSLKGALVSDSKGLMWASVVDGKLVTVTDNDKAFYLTTGGTPTVLFTKNHGDHDYIYYSLTGSNGYSFYRLAYDGEYKNYNKYPIEEDDVNEFTPVQILDLDASSNWYMPEMVGGQILFCSETTNMSAYNYVMACDLRSDNGIMTNVEIDKLNKLYNSVFESIDDIDSTVYENLPNALRYAFYTGDKEYIRTLNAEYVKIKDYDEEHFWSKESMNKYDAFVDVTGDWAEFADKVVKVNDKDVAANKLDYYYAVLGQMSEKDAEDYLEVLGNTYLQEWPEPEDGWFKSLSKGAKAGFLIGVIGGGLILIGVAVFLTWYFLKKRNKDVSDDRRIRYRVDTTDDEEVDVYAVEGDAATDDAATETPVDDVTPDAE